MLGGIKQVELMVIKTGGDICITDKKKREREGTT
jgi:hypothetical protein